MEGYVFKRNKEGIFLINLAKTWEKLMVAARIIAAVQHKNPKDVLVSEILIAKRIGSKYGEDGLGAFHYSFKRNYFLPFFCLL